jgi:sulfate transport system substrate-binding protein
MKTIEGGARRGLLAAGIIGAGLIAAIPAVGLAQDPEASFQASPGAVTLVAYSTPRAAYEEIIPLFQATDAGAGVEFEQSYDASGTQSRAVEAGLPADVVALSLWPDVERLVEPGIVAPDWDENDHKGILHDSVVAFVVRPGNPKGITDWDDLARDDVDVITPNPFTSGGAQWNLLAAYQSQIAAGRSEDEARELLKQVIENTSVMDQSAREALQTFVSGQGDVMIGYENEAIFAQQAGQPIEFVIPESSTMLIENPVAVTLTGDATAPAQAFVDFLYTPDAQRIFGQKGFRPIDPDVLAEFDFAEVPNLFTIDALGGWSEARPRFFDPDSSVVQGIFAELGRQTSGPPPPAPDQRAGRAPRPATTAGASWVPASPRRTSGCSS